MHSRTINSFEGYGGCTPILHAQRLAQGAVLSAKSKQAITVPASEIQSLIRLTTVHDNPTPICVGSGKAQD